MDLQLILNPQNKKIRKKRRLGSEIPPDEEAAYKVLVNKTLEICQTTPDFEEGFSEAIITIWELHRHMKLTIPTVEKALKAGYKLAKENQNVLLPSGLRAPLPPIHTLIPNHPAGVPLRRTRRSNAGNLPKRYDPLLPGHASQLERSFHNIAQPPIGSIRSTRRQTRPAPCLPPTIPESMKAMWRASEHHLTCFVCRENIPDTILMPCRHSFCSECVYRLEYYKLPCPYCRRPFTDVIHDITNDPFDCIKE